MQKDGSGDFTVIQQAVDAAASGDTISVGPGRYEESTQFSLIGTPQTETLTLVGIEKEELTILGSGRQEVFIGAKNFGSLSPELGIATRSQEGQSLTLRNLTVEGVETALFVSGACDVDSCTFRGSDKGVLVYDVADATLRHSTFTGTSSVSGAVVSGWSSNVRFENCDFIGGRDGVLFLQVYDAALVNATIEATGYGIDFENGSTGLVEGCSIRSEDEGIIAVAGGRPHLVNNRIVSTGDTALTISSGAHVSGSGNQFIGGSWATINCGSVGSCDLQNNDVISGTGYMARMDNRNPNTPTSILNLTNNYWGTNGLEEVRAGILDGNVDPDINGFVQFEPILSESVGVEKQSVGGLKGRYRSPE